MCVIQSHVAFAAFLLPELILQIYLKGTGPLKDACVGMTMCFGRGCMASIVLASEEYQPRGN